MTLSFVYIRIYKSTTVLISLLNGGGSVRRWNKFLYFSFGKILENLWNMIQSDGLIIVQIPINNAVLRFKVSLMGTRNITNKYYSLKVCKSFLWTLKNFMFLYEEVICKYLITVLWISCNYMLNIFKFLKSFPFFKNTFDYFLFILYSDFQWSF